MLYGIGDLVRCIWGAKPVEYEARILDVDTELQEYYVHYQGWNKRYDEWITEKSIIGLSKKHPEPVPTTETPRVRHSKREKKVKKPMDWSPAHNPPPRSEEKHMRKKIPHVSTKSKHSPPSKVAKHPAPSVSPLVDDSSDDGMSSDEEIVDLSVPRSYIDVLAREKKKAERRQEQGRTPQLSGSGRSSKFPQAKAVSNGAQAITRLIPTNKPFPASASSSTVSSTCMECHNFASIGADYNYSSLRFHYNKARPLGEYGFLWKMAIGQYYICFLLSQVVKEKILARVKSVAAPSAFFLSENHSALNVIQLIEILTLNCIVFLCYSCVALSKTRM
ncbi:hypothetical protein Y032_0002g982 [Ancylostoma ceylanicum]|uniref:Chromo domain-containing protein n=1 Tax=Ancylostoma ceylanicum TaxID=53326 RepID=A0A016W2F6_9BILA|nr:hypothetical protein Y032_0002g982 [Ancylostoma ceylanicum]